jgi:PST family polysaccharide transporter
VTVWIARHLGPEQFGLLSFGLALVALFGVLARIGLNNIVVRDLVNKGDRAPSLLGTTFVLQFLGALVAMLLTIATAAIVRADDQLARTVILILAVALLFKPSETVKYWFESHVQSKYVVWAENLVLISFATIKVALILLDAPLLAYAWTLFTEACVTGISLLLLYSIKVGNPLSWRFSLAEGKSLLLESWPLALASVAIMIYMRIDQVMLGQIIGDQGVGIYSAAVRITEAVNLIPAAIIASVFPAIIAARKKAADAYRAHLQALYDLMVVLSLTIAVPVTLFSEGIVRVLFGTEYDASATVLAVHVWALLFTSLHAASGRWFILEGLHLLLFVRAILGALINIFLNLLLIPQWGPVGAALATLVSFSASAFWFDGLSRHTWIAFRMKFHSFFVWASIARLWRFRELLTSAQNR